MLTFLYHAPPLEGMHLIKALNFQAALLRLCTCMCVYLCVCACVSMCVLVQEFACI